MKDSSELIEMPRITEPISAPSLLHSLVEEYNSNAKVGAVDTCLLLLKDALGYFVRYYAAVSVAVCRELNCLPGEVAQSWSSSPGVEASLPILRECLQILKTRQERIARKLSLVFFENSGEERAFVGQILSGEEAAKNFLIKFCLSSKQDIAELDSEMLGQAAHLLDAWIAASFSFFLESEQRLETGAYFGQLEQVVCFEQFTLRTGLTMRVYESRGTGQSSPLAPASNSPLALAATEDAVEISAVAEEPLTTEQVVSRPADLPTAAVEEVAASLPVKPVIAPEAEALHRLLQSRQSVVTVAPMKPRSVKVSHETRFEINIEALGFVRSSLTGKIGYGGHLWVNSIDEELIIGTITATGGLVEITPSYFEGTTNRIVYWVHPDEVIASKEYLQIKVDKEERLYPLWRLAPPSRFESVGKKKMAAFLLVPGLAGALYSTWIFYNTSGAVVRELRSSLADNYDKFINPISPLSLKGAGIGQFDVNIKPQLESAVLVYLVMAWLVPVLVTKLYAQYPRREQRSLIIVFLLGCCLPTIHYLLIWNTGLGHSALTLHPELAQLDYRQSFMIFLFLNGCTTLYEVLALEGLFRRFLNELGRVALAVLAAGMAFALILYQVYGFSWFT